MAERLRARPTVIESSFGLACGARVVSGTSARRSVLSLVRLSTYERYGTATNMHENINMIVGITALTAC